MSGLLAVDAAKKDCAWAWFVERELRKCGMGDNTGFTTYDEIVVEVPKIYPPSRQKGDPNDLVDITFSAGVFCGQFNTGLLLPIRPHEWKGQRPKGVDNKYTLRLLYDRERQVVESCGITKSKLHNVIDAIGIGLWRLDRR